jgi:metal-dependent HD superfamily phosphatase/phosphodiesterase
LRWQSRQQVAADFFHAIKSESHATQALTLRDHALNMADELDAFHQGDAI